MNLDENSRSGSDFWHGARSFDPELTTSVSSSFDQACSNVRMSLSEREQERLQRLEREFIGRLIEEYERAVENGLPANRAIASLLEWASRECPRLHP